MNISQNKKRGSRMKRFINCHVPVTACNLRCPYCYVTQNKWWSKELPKFQYSPEHIGKALTQKRLGGVCHFNMCGMGETLLPPEMPDIIKEILKNGHTVMVITNGTLTKRFQEICKFPRELLERLCFKFSLQYVELKRLHLMDKFFENVRMVKKAGCSFSVELTPHDEIIDEIPNIKELCMKELGAYCHVTVGRRDDQPGVPILTNLSREEYYNTWKTFKSEMFEFKMSTFNVKRCEFCYAGAWSLLLDLGTGEAKQCYETFTKQNIFKNLKKPIKFEAVGNNCCSAHCHNSHAFLTLGLIPELDTPPYEKMRNRKTVFGEEWLNETMKNNLSERLYDSNQEYSSFKKKYINFKNRCEIKAYSVYKFVKKKLRNK